MPENEQRERSRSAPSGKGYAAGASRAAGTESMPGDELLGHYRAMARGDVRRLSPWRVTASGRLRDERRPDTSA